MQNFMKGVENSMQCLNKKRKVRNHWKKVIEAQWLKWMTQKQYQKAKKQPELAENLNSASEFSIWVIKLR